MTRAGNAPVVPLHVTPEGLVAYCTRCRTEFRRPVQPGRPAVYCSQECRAEGYRLLREERARLKHFERVVEDLRSSVRNLERGSDEENPAEQARSVMLATARRAVDRAEVALELLPDTDDRILNALRELYTGVAPAIRGH